MAPIRFALSDSCHIDDAYALFYTNDKQELVTYSNQQFAINSEAWKQLISNATQVSVRIMTKHNDTWYAYDDFDITISPDSIDTYLTYRLVEPGYEVWNEMGIYQRNIETYDESALITNKQMGYGCINCHSFLNNNPNAMLFHARATYGATYILRNGQIEKLDTKTPQTISALVYPSWHPSGRYVAFSTNTTKQLFHTINPNRIEVFDMASDVVIYDVEKHTIFSTQSLKSETSFETFPTFSPDGKRLFFCTADTVPMPFAYDNVHYSICSISFDNGVIGHDVDTLYNAHTHGGSASLPRISPNGQWLMFVRSAYGNFSIWHTDADLYMLNLTDSTAEPMILQQLNSPRAESYHSWSSNGHWIAFSSRRIDGLYTRPFFAHIDSTGEWSKPFVMPQPDARYYDRLMKSFNIPEFVQGKVPISSYDISNVAKNETATHIIFDESAK